MILSLSEPPLMPAAIMSIAKLGTCSELQRYSTHTPHLPVEGSVRGDSLTLSVALLSIVGTSTKPDAFHAYISVDGNPVIVSLAPQATISLTYPALSPGEHSVRYGVYRGDVVMQENSFCSKVSSSRKSRSKK